VFVAFVSLHVNSIVGLTLKTYILLKHQEIVYNILPNEQFLMNNQSLNNYLILSLVQLNY